MKKIKLRGLPAFVRKRNDKYTLKLAKGEKNQIESYLTTTTPDYARPERLVVSAWAPYDRISTQKLLSIINLVGSGLCKPNITFLFGNMSNDDDEDNEHAIIDGFIKALNSKTCSPNLCITLSNNISPRLLQEGLNKSSPHGLMIRLDLLRGNGSLEETLCEKISSGDYPENFEIDCSSYCSNYPKVRTNTLSNLLNAISTKNSDAVYLPALKLNFKGCNIGNTSFVKFCQQSLLSKYYPRKLKINLIDNGITDAATDDFLALLTQWPHVFFDLSISECSADFKIKETATFTLAPPLSAPTLSISNALSTLTCNKILSAFDECRVAFGTKINLSGHSIESKQLDKLKAAQVAYGSRMPQYAGVACFYLKQTNEKYDKIIPDECLNLIYTYAAPYGMDAREIGSFALYVTLNWTLTQCRIELSAGRKNKKNKKKIKTLLDQILFFQQDNISAFRGINKKNPLYVNELGYPVNLMSAVKPARVKKKQGLVARMFFPIKKILAPTEKADNPAPPCTSYLA